MLIQILPSLLFGGGLMVLGLWLMSVHRYHAQSQIKLQVPAEERTEQRLLRRRFLRRMQTSGLITIVGLLIPAADAALSIWRRPLAATILLLAILGLIVWIVLLSLGDLLEVRMFSARTRARVQQLQRHQADLLEEIEHLRKKAADEG